MNKTSNRRLDYIDEIRGIAIILVVIGHAIQVLYAPGVFDENMLFKIIYSFHMPLFMCISGYVSGYHQQPLSAKSLCLRLKSLMVPFMVWAFINSIIREEFPKEFVKTLIYVDNGLWFLWVLGLITILFYVCYYCKNLGGGDIVFILMHFLYFRFLLILWELDY